MLVLGQQEEIAVPLTMAQLISLGSAIDPALTEPSIHLVIGQALDEAGDALVTLLTETLPIRLPAGSKSLAFEGHLVEIIAATPTALTYRLSQ